MIIAKDSVPALPRAPVSRDQHNRVNLEPSRRINRHIPGRFDALYFSRRPEQQTAGFDSRIPSRLSKDLVEHRP